MENRLKKTKITSTIILIFTFLLYGVFVFLSIDYYKSIIDYHHELLSQIDMIKQLYRFIFLDLIFLFITILLSFFNVLLDKLIMKKYLIMEKNKNVEDYRLEYFSCKKKLGRNGFLFALIFIISFLLNISINYFVAFGSLLNVLFIIVIVSRFFTFYFLNRVGRFYSLLLIYKEMIWNYQ